MSSHLHMQVKGTTTRRMHCVVCCEQTWCRLRLLLLRLWLVDKSCACRMRQLVR